jgi:hypothetical protein
MVEIAGLIAQDTLKLPHEVAARFRPSDRFVAWVEGDTLHLKRITPPPVTSIVGQAAQEEPIVSGRDQRNRPSGPPPATNGVKGNLHNLTEQPALPPIFQPSNLPIFQPSI